MGSSHGLRLPADVLDAALARVWARALKPEGDGCWTYPLNSKGTTTKQLRVTSVPGLTTAVYPQQLAWMAAHGPIPAGWLVVRTCGNRGCVRPTHLALASDSVRGRSPEASARIAEAARKLTDEQVAAIRQMRAQGRPVHRLARLFRVSKVAVTEAARGRTFSHLPGAMPAPSDWRSRKREAAD